MDFYIYEIVFDVVFGFVDFVFGNVGGVWIEFFEYFYNGCIYQFFVVYFVYI